MSNYNVNLEDVKAVENSITALEETVEVIVRGGEEVLETITPLNIPVITNNVSALKDASIEMMKPTAIECMDAQKQAINIMKTTAMVAGH